jgi:hypothetical protein
MTVTGTSADHAVPAGETAGTTTAGHILDGLGER